MPVKLKIRSKRILSKLVLVILVISCQSLSVQAEKGNLKINNQVIYEKSEGSQANTATFQINQLFLKEMSEQNEQLTVKKNKSMGQVKKELFLKKTPMQQSMDQQIRRQLFSQDYVFHDSADSEDSALQQKSHLGFILFCGIGGLLVVSLGILLGRVFPTWLKKA